MKRIIGFLTILMFFSSASGQWKAQSGETYDKTFRMAYVTSMSGKETLRIIRTITSASGQKQADPYSQMSGQILLNNKIDKEIVVEGIVLKFDESFKIYIHQPPSFSQQWDNGARKYIIESDWQTWRIDDSRNKGGRNNPSGNDNQSNMVSLKEIIALLNAGHKVYCQVILLNPVYGTQSVLNTEFTLSNSTKSIAFLLK